MTKIKSSDLSLQIIKEAQALRQVLSEIPISKARSPEFEFTGGRASACDLLAYQIGWGELFLTWYKSGLQGKRPFMPKKGFGWDYVALAQNFFAQYSKFSLKSLDLKFQKLVQKITAVVEIETQRGNLDKLGVWEWCTLQSGKKWPLRKWIQINTVAPYKRANQIIKKHIKYLTLERDP